MLAYPHPRLRALPDIANAYRRSTSPSAANLARLLPFTDIVHCKDYANAAERFVAFGDGDIHFRCTIRRDIPAHTAPLTLTIETHAPSQPAATTRRSLFGLRRLIDAPCASLTHDADICPTLPHRSSCLQPAALAITRDRSEWSALHQIVERPVRVDGV